MAQTKQKNTHRTSIYIEIPHSATLNSYHPLITFFKNLGISHFYIKSAPAHFSKLNSLAEEQFENCIVKYAHTPILNDTFLRKLQHKDIIFQPLLFCRKNYFIQHKSWGYPVMHFKDDIPEIIELTPQENYVATLLNRVEDIAILFIAQITEGETTLKNVTHCLDRVNGHFKYSCSAPCKLIVLRKMHIYYENGLKYHINIHDDSLLQSHLAHSQKRYKLDRFKGSFLEADSFFSTQNYFTSGPEITRNWSRISENSFKHDLAQHWLQNGTSNQTVHLNLGTMINQYIDGILLAKLAQIDSNMRFLASVENPHFKANLATANTRFKLDITRFISEEEYRINCIINLKQMQSAKRKQPKIKLLLGSFFNITHSFREKRFAIESLIDCHISDVMFNYNLEAHFTHFISENMLTGPHNIVPYNRWVNYINRMVGIGQSASEQSKILLLYPSLDSDHKTLQKVVRILEESSYGYDILTFKTFTEVCTLEAEGLKRAKTHYHTVILPGITTISLSELNKIAEFNAAGGMVICLDHFPTSYSAPISHKELQNKLNAIWFYDTSVKETSYKKNNKGGLGIFQKECNNLPDILKQYISNNAVPIYCQHPKIRVRTYNQGNNMVIHVLNSGEQAQQNIPLTSLILGTVSELDSEEGLLFPAANITYHQKSFTITFNLEGFGSKLFYLQKKYAQTALINNREMLTEYNQISSENWEIECGSYINVHSLTDMSQHLPYSWRPINYKSRFMFAHNLEHISTVILSLGKVEDWCGLTINGIRVGSKLFSPWNFDITAYIKTGQNSIEINVYHRLANYFAETEPDSSHYPITPFGLFGPLQLKIEHKTERAHSF